MSDAAKLLGQLEDMLVAASDLKVGKDGANAIIVAWLRDNLSALRTDAAGEAALRVLSKLRRSDFQDCEQPLWDEIDAARKEAGR